MAHPSIKQRKMARSNGRIIELGDLGRVIPISNPIRLDESSGIFYVMLVQKGKLVIRKFDIKDFGLKNTGFPSSVGNDKSKEIAGVIICPPNLISQQKYVL